MTAHKKRSRGPKVPAAPQGMVGDSHAMRHIRSLVRRHSKNRLTVLVRGETGTGKELVPKALHTEGPRKGKPFIAVSAPNLSASLLESEMFGHERGAFTGAGPARGGLFEAADGGTLFIDEIGDMPLDVQARILRAIQERSVRRVGGSRERKVDVRVVVATNRSIEDMVKLGTFREDLYYRLALCTIEVPPLRERDTDALLLARFFLYRGMEKEGLPKRSLGRDCRDLLLTHRWPGNVRELEGVVYRVLAECSGPSLGRTDFERVIDYQPYEGAIEIISPNRNSIIDVIRFHDRMMSADLRSELGVSKTGLARMVRPYIDSGEIVREGCGRATAYRWAGALVEGE